MKQIISLALAALLAGPPAAAAQDAACPMGLPSTTAALAEIPRGQAITFTTAAAQVEELRGRVRALADAHNARRAIAALGRGSGRATVAPEIPAEATVEVVARGARLVIAADDPADAERLRGALTSRAAYLWAEGCDLADDG